VRLAEAAAATGYRLECFDRLTSTSDEAMARARQGDPGRLWIVAREQSGGRGRLGRSWASPPGNLYASLLLVDPSPMRFAPQLGFVAGVALAAALRTLPGDCARVQLKWPNDVLLDGAKLAGILLEGSQLAGGRFGCVIGIGVNCSSHPEGLAYPATDLGVAGACVGPADILGALSGTLADWIERWQAGSGFAHVRRAWLDSAAGLGEPIEVESGGVRRRGLFNGIDAEGRLVLATGAGNSVVEAGEVFLVGGGYGHGERGGMH
jgi:BirA family biotin operon repressor/biotin-[acetyl-CoA-carboxylase] ligase